MPCTTHPKKGWLPEFPGCTRKREQELMQFSKDELLDLLRRKGMARYFSDELVHLADPKYKAPPPRKAKKQSKKKAAAKKARSCPPQASSPPPSPVGERPATPPSPFQRPPSATASPTARFLSPSNHLSDFAQFFEELNSGDDD